MGNFHTRGISRDRHPQYNEKNESSAQLGQASAEASVTARLAELSLERSEAHDADGWELVLIDMLEGSSKTAEAKRWTVRTTSCDLGVYNEQDGGMDGSQRGFHISVADCLEIEHAEDVHHVDKVQRQGSYAKTATSVVHDLTAIGSWMNDDDASNQNQ